MKLLDSRLEPQNTNMLIRLASAIAACAQLGTLTTPQRIWSLKKLHSLLLSKHAPKPLDPSLSSFLMPLIPSLLKQYEYEESQVRNGVHLMHSEYFKTLAALACDMQLDSMLPAADIHKWAWFKRYCIAIRVAQSLINRTTLPRKFYMDVRKKLNEILPIKTIKALATHIGLSNGSSSSLSSSSTTLLSRNTNTSQTNLSASGGSNSIICNEPSPKATDETTELLNIYEPFMHEDHTIFKVSHDRQLLQWLNRRPEDWTLSWGGASTIYGWGHNHRGQLGGLEGGRIKSPTPCESLGMLRPVQLCGGEQTLYAVTPDGKLYSTGKFDECE